MTLDMCFSVSLAGCQITGGLGDQGLPAAPGMQLRSSVVDLGSAGFPAYVRAGPPRQGLFPVPAIAGLATLYM